MKCLRCCRRRLLDIREELLKAPHFISYRVLSNSQENIKPKPFHEIPGPKSYPLIGTVLNYLPVIGKYKFDRLHRNGQLKLKEFGPLVREEIVPGVNVVWVFKPEDIETVFWNDGVCPERRSHLSIEKYRHERPNVYRTAGLLPTNGREWSNLRKHFQKQIGKGEYLKHYIPTTDKVINTFLDLVRTRIKCQQKHDWLNDFSHLFLELVGLIAFDVELGSLTETGFAQDSIPSQLIHAAEQTNSCVNKLDNGLQLWRFMKTPLYKKMEQGHQLIEKIAIQFVTQKMEETIINPPNDADLSLLEHFLRNPDLEYRDIVGISADFILAGMDTSAFSTSTMLYNVALNPESQKELNREAHQLLPEKTSPVTHEILKNASYTKAVLKESFRMCPVSVGIGRILRQDIVLSGYSVPKGTVAVTQNQISSCLPEYVDEPEKFKPERWLRKHPNYKKIHPYLVLPFGHGPRSCIARHFAEQNMQMLLLKLSRNFEIGWDGGSLDIISVPINKPDKPVFLTFKDLPN